MATHQTDASVEEFLAQVPDDQRREDARRLCVMMQEITGEPPVMWGSSIVGFGAYHYRYASGHEGDSALTSFSPRRQHLVIYLVGEFGDRHRAVLARLGSHKTDRAACTSSVSMTSTSTRSASSSIAPSGSAKASTALPADRSSPAFH
ncbi:MAG: DUF1801 domain-containing protein [Streptosporangiaceae bacterium]